MLKTILHTKVISSRKKTIYLTFDFNQFPAFLQIFSLTKAPCCAGPPQMLLNTLHP